VLLTDGDLQRELRGVAGAALLGVPGCDGASVSVIVEGRPQTLGATDRVILELDLIQYETGQGPCLSAITTGTTVRVDVVGTEERFVHFATAAADAGFLSVLSLPVVVDGEAAASLNLYSTSPNGFDETSETNATVLAAQVGVAIAKSRVLASGDAAVTLAQRELDERTEINQAQGMLMALETCTARQADGLLRSAAATNHESLVAAARRVAATVSEVSRPQRDDS
jgi:GAF domain-containing protein